MKRGAVIGLGLLVAAVAGGTLAWRVWRKAPAMETTPVVQVTGDHAYQYIAAAGLSWDAARTAAQALSWHGHHGYLATIHTAGEYQFILDHVFSHAYPDVTYLGGRQTAPGEWRWTTGPDGSADGGKGLLFWRGDEQGAVQNGLYANWMPTAFQHGGRWDIRQVCCVSMFSYGVPQFSTSLGTGYVEENVSGYLVEFGRDSA
jgi:hypothetical protein